MTHTENVAVESTFAQDRILVDLTSAPYFLHGVRVVDAVVTATRTEASEALVGSAITFPLHEIYA